MNHVPQERQAEPKAAAWRDLEMPYIGDRDNTQSAGA